MKYIVKGHVYVIASAQVEVEASNEAEALEKSKGAFQKTERKGGLVDGNSADTCHPFDWNPLEAITKEESDKIFERRMGRNSALKMLTEGKKS